MASTYKTVSGDTWDLIAYKVLGNEKYMQQILRANWVLSDILLFSAGTEVVIPDVDVEPDDNLPFWHSSDDNSIWGREAT